MTIGCNWCWTWANDWVKAMMNILIVSCKVGAGAHLSVDYLRYYWREPIVKNHVIIGPANLGRNMRYYWGGPMFD